MAEIIDGMQRWLDALREAWPDYTDADRIAAERGFLTALDSLRRTV